MTNARRTEVVTGTIEAEMVTVIVIIGVEGEVMIGITATPEDINTLDLVLQADPTEEDTIKERKMTTDAETLTGHLIIHQAEDIDRDTHPNRPIMCLPQEHL
jgi:hypothetical protein